MLVSHPARALAETGSTRVQRSEHWDSFWGDNDHKLKKMTPEFGPDVLCSYKNVVLCVALVCYGDSSNNNNNNHSTLPCWISSFWACWHGRLSERSVDLQKQSGEATLTCLHAAEGHETIQFGLFSSRNGESTSEGPLSQKVALTPQQSQAHSLTSKEPAVQSLQRE